MNSIQPMTNAMDSIQPTTNAMKTQTKPQREGGHIPSSSRSRRLATTILALTILGPIFAFAQIPPRFYWKSLAGGNAVPVIYQSLSGNANPMDPADLVSADADIDANVAIVGYAKLLPLFDRTLTLAVLEPMGRISTDTTVAGRTSPQDANGAAVGTSPAGSPGPPRPRQTSPDVASRRGQSASVQ